MRFHPTTRDGRATRDERGAGLVEYALLLALIAVVTFSAVSFFGSQNGAGFTGSADCIKAAYDDALDPDDC